MDDSSYLDVRNRMQSLLLRPDVEALMASAQDGAPKEQTSGTQAASAEESKAAGVSPVKEPTSQSAFKIDDDDDDDEYEVEDDTQDQQEEGQQENQEEAK